MMSDQFRSTVFFTTFMILFLVYIVHYLVNHSEESRLHHHGRSSSRDDARSSVGRISCSGEPCFVCDNISRLSSLLDDDATPLGSGFYKQAFAIRFGDRSLVVKVPHERSAPYLAERWAAKNNGEKLTDNQVRTKLAAKFADESAVMLSWVNMATSSSSTDEPIVPRVFGGCYSGDETLHDGLSIVTVVEPLRAIADVTFDTSISLAQRLTIGASLMSVIRRWDALTPFNHSRADTDTISNIKEYRVVNATAMIYGDFDPKQVMQSFPFFAHDFLANNIRLVPVWSRL